MTESSGGAGGYEYKFLSTPLDRYFCVICQHPSRDPCLSVCCGHVFCKCCIDKVKDTCPMCRDKRFPTFPNKQLDREIKNLDVICTNVERGCMWQGKLGNIGDHLEDCQFEEVKCTNKCEKIMQRRYLTAHIESDECPRRQVTCKLCHNTIEHQFIEGKHKEEYPKVLLPCPNNCNVDAILREDMETHRKECPLEMIQCEYHSVGCETSMLRMNKQVHEDENKDKHLMLTKDKLQQIGALYKFTSLNKPRKVVNIDGSMSEPCGIAFGKNGMWAVTDFSNHCVCIFDGEDQLVRKFGSHGSGDGQFIFPKGVAFDSDDHLYVTDCINHRVQKFTIDGKYLLQFGGEGSDDGKLKWPKGLAVHNHKVYVADAHSDNKGISVFQSDGIFLHTFGSGQLGNPYDVTVNGDNQLLVADHHQHCIYTFTLDGNYVGKFGTRGTGRGELNHPLGVAVDLHGFILVTDSYNDRVSIFNKYGNFVHCFGSRGSAVGQFDYPSGIAVSANGDIYVSDHHNKRVQIFS